MKNTHNTAWKMYLNLLMWVILFWSKTLSAQDTLTLVTGAQLIVEIKEVNDEYVLFSLWADTTNIKLPLNRVHSSSYKGQNSNMFYLNPQEEKIVLASLPEEPISMEALARSDANMNYNHSSGSGTGTFVATLLGTPVIGLFVALGISATPPPDKKLNPPNKSLFKNKTYYDAYRKEAHKIKQRRVWAGFGIGVAADVVLVGIILSEIDNMVVY